MSINADRTDLQFSFILKTTSTQKNKAMYKMSCLSGEEMKIWLTKLKLAMKMNMDIATEIARTKKPSGNYKDYFHIINHYVHIIIVALSWWVFVTL